jgi:hypothetical protein
MRGPLLLLALAALLATQAGCGMSAQPRAGMRDRGTVGLPGEDASGPQSWPAGREARDPRPAVDRICRASSMPRGWIAIGYEASQGKCPATPRVDAEYSLAVIERHSHMPVGTVMLACADQPVPRNWVREWHLEPHASCAGARVRDGAPTSYLMRRVR